MQSKILDQEHLWEEFIKTHPLATIHQHPKWGHFQSAIKGRGKYWIVALTDAENQIIGGTLIVRHSLPKGYSWLYAPRGPLVDYSDPAQLKTLMEPIKAIARAEKAVFLRIDPPLGSNSSPKALQEFKATKYGFQPEHTLLIDLSQSEEEILAQMKPKGRYNIRLAEKKGIKISHFLPGEKNIEPVNSPSPGSTPHPGIQKSEPVNSSIPGSPLTDFYSILKETTTRDGFHAHGQDYYEKMLLHLGENAALYLAYHQNRAIAGVIVTYFNDTATYYYGASGNKDRNLMAPYLLHWQIMKDAKAKGFKTYDLFGISPPNSPNHPWQGVTEFKSKFGGQHHSYLQAHEYPFKKLIYPIYTIYKKIRK